jgi:hypothetical protein
MDDNHDWMPNFYQNAVSEDFCRIVCGMSSNVCRLVQILRHQDPSTAISLDEEWYGI